MRSTVKMAIRVALAETTELNPAIHNVSRRLVPRNFWSNVGRKAVIELTPTNWWKVITPQARQSRRKFCVGPLLNNIVIWLLVFSKLAASWISRNRALASSSPVKRVKTCNASPILSSLTSQRGDSGRRITRTADMSKKMYWKQMGKTNVNRPWRA
jgi:hypothetical protein